MSAMLTCLYKCNDRSFFNKFLMQTARPCPSASYVVVGRSAYFTAHAPSLLWSLTD